MNLKANKTMKNIFRFGFASLILTVLTISASAQGTPVSAGGDAKGSGGTVSYSVGEVVYTTKKSISGFVIEGIQQGYTTSELPISLLAFTAKVSNKSQVQLSWETSSEQNNKFFDVERSVNGVSFSSILTENSKGNSTSIQAYTAEDNDPYIGIAYYRLKQIDIDGKTTYSKTIAVTIISSESELKAFPNPTTSILNLQIDNAATRKLVYALYTIDGRLIVQQNINNTTTTITTSSLANGTYLLHVKDKGILVKSFKIIKN